MTREVYNLQGEIVSAHDPDGCWRHFDSSFWLLIGGLLLIAGSFVDPGVIDSCLLALDPRTWVWWYFLVAITYMMFAIQWFRIYRASEWDTDYATDDRNDRFKIMSIVVSAELALIVLLHATGVASSWGYPFYLWYTYGTFSWWAIITFAALLGVLVVTFYYVREWVVTFYGR